jgi:hypothetical protein
MIPRITSVDCGSPNRQRFPSEVHVLFCTNLLHTHTCTSPRMARSVCCLLQPVLYVYWAFCYFPCDCVVNLLTLVQPWLKSIAILLPSAGEILPVYNNYVTLNVMCCKKRDEHEADIVCAAQIPGMLIHTCLKSAQAVERKTFTTLRWKLHAKVVMKWRFQSSVSQNELRILSTPR